MVAVSQTFGVLVCLLDYVVYIAILLICSFCVAEYGTDRAHSIETTSRDALNGNEFIYCLVDTFRFPHATLTFEYTKSSTRYTEL